jgi:hypothetical protein
MLDYVQLVLTAGGNFSSIPASSARHFHPRHAPPQPGMRLHRNTLRDLAPIFRHVLLVHHWLYQRQHLPKIPIVAALHSHSDFICNPFPKTLITCAALDPLVYDFARATLDMRRRR